MIADGLWQDRRHRLPSPHQPRRRRDCPGELVQIDGSQHAWFEDRGPPRTLLTQFGRALLALNIDIICANSPQAKRCYGASGEDKASSSLETTDGVPHAAAE
jgi:hypothetical protein